jgi:branched-chain amino acid transport system ATP-binding protein
MTERRGSAPGAGAAAASAMAAASGAGAGAAAGRGEPLLAVSDLDVCYGAVEALRGVSLVVHAGEVVTLIGANGAGKTTLLRTISGLLAPRRGRIVFAAQDITRLAAHRIVACGISQVPEGRIIFANLSVRDNLELGAYRRRDRAEIRADLERMFTLFPRLKERERQRGGTLSGGEQQMLAIARGLMSRPRLLLMDEPSLGLAPILVREIFRTVAEISRQGVTILLVEQNAHMALGIADRGYVMETGRIVLSDTRENLLRNEEVKNAYLGG